MFAPGFFAADYFAPGFWPDATDGAASSFADGAAVLAGSSSLVASAVASGRVRLAGGGALIRHPWPRHLSYADGAASISGSATMVGQARGIINGAARLAGVGALKAEGEAVFSDAWAESDHAFWALAA